MRKDSQRARARAASTAPLLNPVQVHDLRRILPLVPNDRRLLVIAAMCGIYVGELYDRCGLTPRIRNYHANGGHTGANSWRDLAMVWCWRISKKLGIPFTELWEIDDDFDPARAVPVALVGPNASRLRAGPPVLRVVGR